MLKTYCNLMLFGLPNNIDREAGVKMMRALMTTAKAKMIDKNPTKYPCMTWGRGLPEFFLTRDFVKNTAFVLRDDEEDLPGWAKNVVHIEVATEDEHTLQSVLEYMKRNGMFKANFGEFAWLVINPGWNATFSEKDTLGSLVERHAAVMLCIGKVPLREKKVQKRLLSWNCTTMKRERRGQA